MNTITTTHKMTESELNEAVEIGCAQIDDMLEYPDSLTNNEFSYEIEVGDLYIEGFYYLDIEVRERWGATDEYGNREPISDEVRTRFCDFGRIYGENLETGEKVDPESLDKLIHLMWRKY